MSVHIAQAFQKILSDVMHENVIYRPTLGKLTGSVTAAMLLERIRFYYKKVGRDFYKFNDKCDHSLYEAGDSWQETLGFTRSEFETARKKIGTRVSKGDVKADMMEVFNADGNIAPKERIVLYWRDKNNVMWYRFNEQLYLAHLIKTVNAEIPNAEIQHYLAMLESNITYEMQESNITFISESHKETNKEDEPQPQEKPSATNTTGEQSELDQIEALLDSIEMFKNNRYKDRLIFHSDFADYPFADWLAGFEIFKDAIARKMQEQGEKYTPLPYKFYEQCVSGIGIKRKQAALIEANKPVEPSHRPMQFEDPVEVTEEEKQHRLAELRKLKELMAS